jgi:hypothetical protein
MYTWRIHELQQRGTTDLATRVSGIAPYLSPENCLLPGEYDTIKSAVALGGLMDWLIRRFLLYLLARQKRKTGSIPSVLDRLGYEIARMIQVNVNILIYLFRFGYVTLGELS